MQHQKSVRRKPDHDYLPYIVLTTILFSTITTYFNPSIPQDVKPILMVVIFLIFAILHIKLKLDNIEEKLNQR